MTQINPKKLLRSKWTAVKPKHKEKHFMITELILDEKCKEVLSCMIEAVLTKRTEAIDWHQLKDKSTWRQGWV